MIRKGLIRPLHTFTTYCSILMLISSCIGTNDVSIKLKNPKKKESTAALPPVTVSNVQVINHQIIITGTNLASVSQFKIKEGSSNITLQIESKTATTIVANTLSNVTFAAGKILDFILSNAEAASTFTVNFSLCDSSLGGKGFNCLITPNDKEVLSYDAASGKWKPRAVNGLSYQGAWDANDPQPTTTTAGDYFIVSVSNAPYSIGDWIVFNGTSFDHINNSSAITSVFGRTGVVTATEGDYSINQMSDVDTTTAPPLTGDVLKYNGTRWVPGAVSAGSGGTVTNVTGSGPISVMNGASTPAISIAQANTTTSGYLTNTDWNTFNNKQPAIAAGTATQYYRGDKTWQTLDTLAVPENTNLYFTNARVLGVPLTGFSTATGAVVATDTILAAIGKLQGQMNLKSDSAGFVDWSTAGVATLEPTRLNLTTADRAVVTSATGTPVASSVTTTELGYVSGVTSAIQTQLNAKQSTISKSTVQDASKIRIYGANATNYVELSATTLTGNRVLTFPDANGANGNVLTTDGSGNLSWTAPATGGAPSGSAGGDLTGTYPNPTIAANAITDSHIANGAIAQAKINGLTTALAGKEPTITAAGNTTTYYRGDKSWQTLDTNVVPENSNLYYTNARGIASIITGLSTATNAVITATDSILVAFGKLQAQITGQATDISNKADRTNVTQTITAATVTGLSAPLAGADATNKTYVDAQVAGASNQWTLNGGNVYRSTGNVGIGTSTPLTALTIQGTGGSSDDVYIDSYADSGEGALMLRRARTNSTTPTTLLANDRIGFLSFRGYNGTAYSDLARVQGIAETDLNTSSSGALQFYTTNAGSNTEKMRISAAGNVGIGTNNPTSNLHMVINEIGTIRMQDSQAAGSQLIIGEGTSSANLFSPTILGTSVGAARFTHFVGETKVAEDTGTVPVFVNSARRDDNSAITTRPLFDWRNASTSIMTMSASGKVGIGTTSPTVPFEVRTAVSASEVHPYRTGIMASSEGTDVSGRIAARVASTVETPSFLAYRSRGTIASPATVNNNDALLSLASSAHDGTTWQSGGVGGAISFFAEENWTATNHGSYMTFTTTSSGASGVNAERMRINGSGNVGIGTSTPTYADTNLTTNNWKVLTVAATPTTAAGAAALTLANQKATPAAGDRVGAVHFVSTNNGTQTYTGFINVSLTGTGGANGLGGEMGFYTKADNSTSSLQRMVITNSGLVGIGTSTPGSPLEIAGTGSSPLRLRKDTGSSFWQVGPDAANNFVIYNSGGTGVYVSNGSTGWTANSDRRIKKNIELIPESLSKLLQISGVTYNYKTDSENEPRRVGVIAQEVKKVLPEAISEKNGILGVRYQELVPLVINAFKELYNKVTGHDKQIATQARQIASLKAENAELKERLDRIEKALSKK